MVRYKGVARGLIIGLITLEVKWRLALGRIASEGWRSAAARSCSMAASSTAARLFQEHLCQ
jgi:hypothetical protein